MSAINPSKQEYETPDGLKIAKDVSWVIRTLWTGAVVTVLAAIWVAALAADVHSNTEKIEEKASTEQLAAVAATLERIEGKIDEQGKEQQKIKESTIRLETKVEALEKVSEQN